MNIREDYYNYGTGKITPKQQEILDYIKSQILERGFPPQYVTYVKLFI